MHAGWYFNFVISALLQIALGWRAFRSRLWVAYPLFYIYLAYTALWSVVFALAPVKSPGYAKAYWWTYFFATVLRFGIAAEVYRYTFPSGSPVRRRASMALLFATAVLACVFLLQVPGPSPFAVGMRKIALSAAIIILITLSTARYYQIRIGRNLWGMATGILIFTGSELLYLAGMDVFPRLWLTWRYVHPIAFVLMLSIWTSALWNYHPNPRMARVDEESKRAFLSIWRDRWLQVPNIVRSVMKP